MKTISRYIMTLALLITAVGGAWATDEVLLTTVTATSQTTYSQSPDGIVTLALSGIDNYIEGFGWVRTGGGTATVTVEATEGYTITRCVFKQNADNYPNRVIEDDLAPFVMTINGGGMFSIPSSFVEASDGQRKVTDMDGLTVIEVYGYLAEPPIKVTPVAGKTNEWTFTMPAFDVEIAPIYAPTADWAIVETVKQLPTAAEGIYAESTDSIITPGKVAMMGETENPQGIVMYFATGDKNMTAAQAMAADGWLSKLPTAAGYERDTTIYVWYYIKGADTPQGQDPTAENTFNDSEICATPITVTVLSNKFDIQFNAANDNTIEAGKATVTVGGTATTVTEGKLTGVKMGSEVKVTAKDGYKFRKVEVKKGGAAPAPAKPEYADNAEELPANTKLYMRADLVYVGDWIWIPTYTAEQAQAVANYYAAITGTKCAVIYGHGSGTDIYYVTSDNGVSGTVYRNEDLTNKFPGYKVYLLK